MALLTVVNLMSTRSYGEFEFWFASIKVAAIIVFIAVAGSYALGLDLAPGQTFGNLVATTAASRHSGRWPCWPASPR